jgi:aminopeptidase N
VTTEQFRALAAQFLPPKPADRQLESFFDNWVYATGIPTLQFRHTVRGKATAWRVTGTLTQSDVATDFGIDVPLEIHLGKGKVETHWLQTDTEPTSFSFALRQKPVKVVLAPGDSVLAVMK